MKVKRSLIFALVACFILGSGFVVKAKPVTKAGSSSVSQLQTRITGIKLFSRISNEYLHLYTIGEKIYNVQTELLVTGKFAINGDTSLVDSLIEDYNYSVDYYNSGKKYVSSMITEASKYKISLKDMSTIMSNYLKILQLQKQCIESLNDISENGSEEDINNFVESMSSISKVLNSTKATCLDKYSYFYALAQKF